MSLLTSSIRKASALAATAKPTALDARWMIPLALYRLSGRRLGRSSQLYRAGVLRQRLARVPGMTSLTERAYFKWHAQEKFLGNGEIVDLGSWLGSTTVALAMGLRANPRPEAQRAKVHAYDDFIWEWWMEQYADIVKLGPYSPGSSFLKEFESVVAPWRDRIEVHVGDLLEQDWPRGGIELLLIDAMKSWDLTHHILTRFYRSLIRGGAYVLHQDFANCYTPWIPLVSYMLRDYLVPVQDIVRSETMVFCAVRSFEDAPALLELARASFAERDVELAFQHALRITNAEKHSGIRAARAMLLVYDDDVCGARDLLRFFEENHMLNDFHAIAVRGAIEDAERARVS